MNLPQTLTPLCQLHAQADPNVMHGFYEFFAGGGMARVGLGPKFRCVFANDFDHQKGQSYRSNFGGDHLKVTDVASLKLADLPGTPDLVWASPPCQDISLAGNCAGLDGSRSGAFWPWWHLMRDLIEGGRAPRVVAIENVEALLTSNKGGDFTAICAELVAAGYNVGALVIDAVLFAPQSRARVFVVAVRADAVVPPQLMQDAPEEPFHTKALCKAVAKFPPALRAAWRWWKLPSPPLRNLSLLDIVQIEARCDSDAETSRLLELMEPLHLAKVEEARRSGQPSIGAVCRRMRAGQQRAEGRFDGVAQALRCPGGGSSIQRFLLIDGATTRSRRPTPRECARLMGLPDDYVLPHSTQDAYWLTGDGVVAPVVRWLATNLFEPLL